MPPVLQLLGVMKQSNEGSIEEAKSQLASEGQDGRCVFKAIRAVATPDEARARVTTVNVPRDLTLHVAEIPLHATY